MKFLMLAMMSLGLAMTGCASKAGCDCSAKPAKKMECPCHGKGGKESTCKAGCKCKPKAKS